MSSGGCFIRVQIVFYKTLIGNNFVNLAGKNRIIYYKGMHE